MIYETAQVGFERIDGQYAASPIMPIRGGPVPVVTEADIVRGAQELNESWHIALDPKPDSRWSAQSFEIGVINPGQKDIVLVAMTSNGGPSVNAGNSLEEIAAAGANPNATRVIINMSGVGGTDTFPLSDLAHYARYGRSTKGQGTPSKPYEPLKAARAAVRVLEAEEIIPNHGTANAEGVDWLLGISKAMDQGVLLDLFLNNPLDLSPKGRYGTDMLTTDIKDRLAARVGENDRWAVTAELKQEIRALLPNIYKTAGHASLVAFSNSRVPANQAVQWAAHRGTKRKDLDNPAKHAKVQDLLAVMLHHKLAVTINTNVDGKFNDVEGSIRFCETTLNQIPVELRAHDWQLKLLLGAGGHDRHTAKPSERWANERRALSSILYQVMGRPPGLTAQQPPDLGAAEAS